MAKGIYYGITKTAGETIIKNIAIESSADLSQYFTVTTSAFSHCGNGVYQSSNVKVNSSTATLTLVAKQDYQNFICNWRVSSESYDYLQIRYKAPNASSYEEILKQGGVYGPNVLDPINLPANSTLQFRYVKNSSGWSGDDAATISHMSFVIKLTYNTTEHNIVTPIQRVYIGVDNVAKQIIEGYVGINNKAQRFWTLTSVKYDGVINLSSSISAVASSKLKTFAARGLNISTYDKDLTCLENASTLIPATHASWPNTWVDVVGNGSPWNSEMSFNNFVVFATGEALTTMNDDLTSVGWPWHGPYQQPGSSNTYTNLRSYGTAATQDYALLGGGFISGTNSRYSAQRSAVPYTTNGTMLSRVGFPSNVTANIGTCNFNNTTIWAGGFYGNAYSTTYYQAKGVCQIDNNLTTKSLSDLSDYTTCPICAAIGNHYAIIAGGGDSSNGSGSQRKTAYAYNPAGTRQILSYTLHPDVAIETALKDENAKAIFRSTTYSTNIDTIDSTLTLIQLRTNMSETSTDAISGGKGTRLGLRSFIFGGEVSSTEYPYIEIYEAY